MKLILNRAEIIDCLSAHVRSLMHMNESDPVKITLTGTGRINSVLTAEVDFSNEPAEASDVSVKEEISENNEEQTETSASEPLAFTGASLFSS